MTGRLNKVPTSHNNHQFGTFRKHSPRCVVIGGTWFLPYPAPLPSSASCGPATSRSPFDAAGCISSCAGSGRPLRNGGRCAVWIRIVRDR